VQLPTTIPAHPLAISPTIPRRSGSSALFRDGPEEVHPRSRTPVLPAAAHLDRHRTAGGLARRPPRQVLAGGLRAGVLLQHRRCSARGPATPESPGWSHSPRDLRADAGGTLSLPPGPSGSGVKPLFGARIPDRIEHADSRNSGPERGCASHDQEHVGDVESDSRDRPGHQEGSRSRADRSRVAGKHCCVPAPSEPYVRLAPHTAQAFTNAPLGTRPP